MTKEEFLPMLQEQQASGLTVVEYCQIQSISPSTFNYWKQKYGVTKRKSQFVNDPSFVNKPSGLVPVQVHNTPTGTSHYGNNSNGDVTNGLLIQLPNGVQVEFASSSDHVAIQMLNTMCSRYV